MKLGTKVSSFSINFRRNIHERKKINVVGTMFFKDGKLLIDKPRKRPTFQMIGRSVENGETTLQATNRECHEELG